MAKKETVKVDGLSAKNIEQIRRALRQVWSWSYPRRLCVKRATIVGGFGRCEKCHTVVSKVFADHIRPCGDVRAPGYIDRLFTPSKNLQALCKKCHDKKTRGERKALALSRLVE